jgi:hypothetical protein
VKPQLSFDEFKAALIKHSRSDLMKLAKGDGLKLPSGLDSQEKIITAMWEARSARSEASTKTSDPPAGSGAPPPTHPPPAGPRIRVLLRGGTSFWRHGVNFRNRWQEMPASDFSEAQLEDLRAHPRLVVRDV